MAVAAPVPIAPDSPAVVDLLGVLAYGELSGFDRMAKDARYSPTLPGRIQLSRMAAVELAHFARIAEHLASLGVPVETAMLPFIEPVNKFHESTPPHSWLESLVKSHVGDGLASDFYRELAGWIDPETQGLVLSVLDDSAYSEFAVREVRAACADDSTLTGSLALWGRRLLGEAITQAQEVAEQRSDFMELIARGTADDGGLPTLLKRLQHAHAARMKALGLA